MKLLNSFQSVHSISVAVVLVNGECMASNQLCDTSSVSLTCKYWAFLKVLNELNDDNNKKNIFIFHNMNAGKRNSVNVER